MPSVFKSRDGYRAQVSIDGQRKSKSFRTRREATAWGAAQEHQAKERAETPVGSRLTLAEVMRRYGDEVSPSKGGERWEQIRISAMLKSPDFPVGKVGEITPDMLGKWRDLRLKQVGPGSVLRELGLLSAIFEHARREWRLIPANPVQDVRKPAEPKHREVVITRAQIKAMLRVMGYSPSLPIRSVAQAVACCFLVALRTGMRAGELCALRWSDVFNGYCRVAGVEQGAKKTGRRDVPLTPKAERLLAKMRGFDPGSVFGLKVQSMDSMFRKYRIRAGLSGFVFHDSRHTAATWLAQRLHILDLCKMFGWSNPKRAMTYYNPKAADIAKRIISKT